MKNLLLLSVFVVSSAHATDLLSDLKAMQTQLAAGAITDSNCHEFFQAQLSKLQEERLQKYDANKSRHLSYTIMETTWQVRLAAHDHLASLLTCRDDMRQVFYKLRGIEDLASLNFYRVTQKKVADFPNEMQNEPVPLVDNNFFDGYLGPDGKVTRDPVTLSNGDIMLSRGDSNFSGELSAVSAIPTQYDHVILLHKTDKGVVESVESYATGTPGGVTRFALDFALKNENPRIELFRAKDQALAAKAADFMYDGVLAGEADPSKVVAYDYTISGGDLTHMTCAEVASFGYLQASGGTFHLPQDMSLPNPKLTQLFTQTGIRPDPMFAPTDLEFDTRFDMILEFRDHRLVEDMRRHDVVAQSIFHWMADLNYEVKPSAMSFFLTDILLPIHKTRLWSTIQKITGIEVPNGAPSGFIVMLKQLDKISDVLLKKVVAADENYKAKTGWYMSHDQMMQILEDYRKLDLFACKVGFYPGVHKYLSPINCF